LNDAKSIAFAEYQLMSVFVLVAPIYFVRSYPLSLWVRSIEMRIGHER
jgi:ABC-type amino acid transport system permease subunit